MVDNQSLDFYTLRFFLYKYTPDFTKNNEKPPTADTGKDGRTTSVVDQNAIDAKEIAKLSKIDRYEFELTDNKDRVAAPGTKLPPTFFRKFDITQYVTNYTFNQTLNENTFNWSVSLQNAVIPLNRLNKTLLVEGPELSESGMKLLSEFESQARDMADDFSIHVAKVNRGLNESELETRDTNRRPQLKTSDKSQRRFSTSPKTEFGILLSDLIQPYDMVSMFLYKRDEPIEEVKGTIDIATGRFIVDTERVPSLRRKDSLLNHLTDEKALRSPDNTTSDATRSIFSNEFNGFVQDKSTNISAGAVDTVTVSGDGITRLFGSTRRVIKSGLFQKTIFDTLESEDQNIFTSYQNIYSDKALKDIFIDLFSLVYKIKPTNLRNVLDKTVLIGGREVSVSSPIFGDFQSTDNEGNLVIADENVAFPSASFYDISALEVANTFQTNPFTIPPYLLALVMKRHGFNVRHPNNPTDLGQLAAESRLEATTNKKNVESKFTFGTTGDTPEAGKTELSTDQELIDQAVLNRVLDRTESSTQTRTGTRSPLFYSEELNVLRPYFRHFDKVLKDFSPEMKTPFEIIDEIKAKTFVEFFERPDGQIFIRAPEYNDVKFTIKSSTINVINATYNETARGIISRQSVGYSIDALPNIPGVQFFAYTNGKLLAQYGFMEAMADSNPNAKDVKTEKSVETQKNFAGIIRYAEYLLRLHNASLKTGTIVCGYDPRIMVGRTYYDERNNKFGYITTVSKAIATGGNATITFNLSYVRDAFFDVERDELQFERLDRLVDLADSWSQENVDRTVVDPESTPQGTGKTTTEVKEPTLIVSKPSDDDDIQNLPTTTLQ